MSEVDEKIASGDYEVISYRGRAILIPLADHNHFVSMRSKVMNYIALGGNPDDIVAAVEKMSGKSGNFVTFNIRSMTGDTI